MGYHRAGFDEVVGVDIHPQPRYPFTFVQADALEFCKSFGAGFDAIHASPPCQAYSRAAQSFRNAGKEYPNLLPATREVLRRSGRPWAIENVPGAPMAIHVRLCGCQVGLPIRRARHFELSVPVLELTHPCSHDGPVVSVVGHGTPSWVRERLGYNPTIHQYREAMGITWMNRDELSQAIPPAYTEFIGRQLLDADALIP